MGIFEAGYALFEYTNQRLWDIYDLIVSTPAIVKIFQSKNKRKNRRKERGVIGNLQKTKNPLVKKSDTRLRLRDDSPSISKDQKVPVSVKPTPEAPEKIKKLESELTKLRDEINKLMSNPKLSTAPPPPPNHVGGTCGTISFPAQPVVPPSFVPNTPTSTAPPAPPPLPTPNSTPVKPKPVRSDRVVTKRHAQQKGTMSLAEVLKGASTSNLRKTDVERSPGGTPIETPSKNKPLNPTDPQEMIAAALRKKFQNLHKHSSETPESSSKRKGGNRVKDDEWDDDTHTNSPDKKVKRVSPIRDENVAPVENVDPAFQ